MWNPVKASKIKWNQVKSSKIKHIKYTKWSYFRSQASLETSLKGGPKIRSCIYSPTPGGSRRKVTSCCKKDPLGKLHVGRVPGCAMRVDTIQNIQKRYIHVYINDIWNISIIVQEARIDETFHMWTFCCLKKVTWIPNRENYRNHHLLPHQSCRYTLQYPPTTSSDQNHHKFGLEDKTHPLTTAPWYRHCLASVFPPPEKSLKLKLCGWLIGASQSTSGCP